MNPKRMEDVMTQYLAASPMDKVMIVGAFRAKARQGEIPVKEALFLCGFFGGCSDVSEELLAKLKEP